MSRCNSSSYATHRFHHGLHKVGALAGLDSDDVAEELAGRCKNEGNQIVSAVRVDELAVLDKHQHVSGRVLYTIITPQCPW